MTDFDWQTEEESDWTETLPPSQERIRPRSWRSFFILLVAALFAGSLFLWQIRSRVEGAETARHEDLIAAHNLLVYAADKKDPAVLLNVLSLDDANWTALQSELLRQDLLLDGWPLGLQRSSQPPVIQEILLSPDLQSAEVTFNIPYETNHGGRSESVRLQQTYQYNWSNGWRWVEPDEAYWGSTARTIYRNSAFTVFYPKRDSQVVRRLADDLASNLADLNLCNGPGQPRCGFVLSNIYLRFGRQPAAWLELLGETAEGSAYLAGLSPSSIGSGMISLPTPSLVGLPADEAGYQALLRGYTSQLVAAIIGELYAEQCCPGDLAFAQFLETELARRGLGFWPPYSVSQAIAAEEEGQLPDNDISLLCYNEDYEALHLFRYSPATGRMQAELAGRKIVRIRSAPGGRGIVLQEAEAQGDEQLLTRLIYWHNQTARILYEELLPEPVFAALSWQIHEEEQRLLLTIPDLDSRVNTFFLFDLSDCADGRCPYSRREMIGSPTWSPDSEQFLVKSGNILWWRQFVGDELEQRPLGLGTVPIWLDSQTFGYVRTLPDQMQEVVTGRGADKELAVAFTSERLRLLLPEEERPARLMIGHIGVNDTVRPGEPNRWTVMAFEWLPTGNLGEVYVFSYNSGVDTFTLLLQSEQLHSFSLSPDGQLLAAALLEANGPSWLMVVESVGSGENNPFLLPNRADPDQPPRYDWTAGSDWLLVLHQGLLTLYNPRSYQSRLVAPPIPGCVQAAWLN